MLNAGFLLALGLSTALSAHPFAAPGITSLTNKSVTFTTPEVHHVELKRGNAAVIIADNAAVDVPALAGHREGYNGAASWKIAGNDRNIFVPAYAGLNLGHIHDGTLASSAQFERVAPDAAAIIKNMPSACQPPTATGSSGWTLSAAGRWDDRVPSNHPRGEVFRRTSDSSGRITFRNRKTARSISVVVLLEPTPGPAGFGFSPQHGGLALTRLPDRC
jgi:hypothetical protein